MRGPKDEKIAYYLGTWRSGYQIEYLPDVEVRDEIEIVDTTVLIPLAERFFVPVALIRRLMNTYYNLRLQEDLHHEAVCLRYFFSFL